MRKVIVALLILIILGLIGSFFYFGRTAEQEAIKNENKVSGEVAGNGDVDINKSLTADSDSGVEGNTGGGGGGGGGSGGGGGGGGGGGAEIPQNETPPDTGEIPEDLYTVPCGFYLEKYGVCNGTCPSGSCFSEGRSCYCKNI